MTTTAPHWADVLDLRPEVRSSDGSVGELQMSLHKAVYQTVDVPYRKVEYYGDITQPTPNLVGFFGKVARRLGTDADAPALFHLDQGMGGGKSHALVGLFHMANSPQDFFATDLGRLVETEAARGTGDVDLSGAIAVTLTADYFSPGATSEVYGPATSLFQRFVWSLVEGDMDAYQRYVAMGANKGTIQRALSEARCPVLILLDELMDYAMALADAEHLGSMPSEQGFLNALMDACDDVPRVALVIVMIKSELDERGYSQPAVDFRDYVAARLVRNGQSVSVTEAGDFSSIIRRRLFEVRADLPLTATSQRYGATADAVWQREVFDALGPNRGLAGFQERVVASYPFHPELMRLVREEWSRVAGFQRVRSTVAIFARTALHWVDEHRAGRWAPTLIGTGDIPLAVALEQVLSSGLLLGNDRAIQGFRAVATTDVTSTDGLTGRAVVVDGVLAAAGVTFQQPAPAVRMATALFAYSVVARAQGRRGATKAELLLAIFGPAGEAVAYPAADEVFNMLTGDEGLGALEVTRPANAPARFLLSIKQTLRMYYNAALALIPPETRVALVWEEAKRLAAQGVFGRLVPVEQPVDLHAPLASVFADVDSEHTRLVLLDPRRWSLLNGRDTGSRQDIDALYGLGTHGLRVDNAASCVVACINAQRRETASKRAHELLAWQEVARQLTADDEEELRTCRASQRDVASKLEQDVKRAYQHYSYLVRSGDLRVEYRRFDDDNHSALNGNDVWSALVAEGRASAPRTLGKGYVAALLDDFGRELTPREIVQSFYKHPAFPLVVSIDEIRRVVFELLSDEWELVAADGSRLQVDSPGQISIGSLQQTLRRRRDDEQDVEQETPRGEDASAPSGDGGPTPGPVRTGRGGTTQAPSGPVAYKRYRLRLSNKSLVDADNREQARLLVSELRKVVDAGSGGADHQLLSLDITLVTAEGQQGELEARATALGGQVTVEDEDF